MSENNDRLRELVAQVASSYFSNSHVTPAEIPTILNQIASTLGAVRPSMGDAVELAKEEPVVAAASPAQIRKSVTHDALISFEDNRPYRTLRRHLAARGLTPEEYRAKWGLPDDYPLIAAGYSAKRSALAHSIGLGRKQSQTRPATAPVANKKSSTKDRAKAATR